MALIDKKVLGMLKFQLAFVVPAIILIVQLWGWNTSLLGYLCSVLVATTVGLVAAKLKGWQFPLNLGEFLGLVLPIALWLVIAMRALLLTSLYEPRDQTMLVVSTETCTRRCGGCAYRITVSRSWQEAGNAVCPDPELAKALRPGDAVVINGVFTPYSSYYRQIQMLSRNTHKVAGRYDSWFCVSSARFAAVGRLLR